MKTRGMSVGIAAVVAAMILLAGAAPRAGAQTSQSSTRSHLINGLAVSEVPYFQGPGSRKTIYEISSSQKDVLDLQKKFQELSVAGDTAGVAGLMSEEAIFIHGNGAAQSKAEFLTAMAAGQLALSLYELKDPKVVIFDGGAIVSGLVDIAFKAPPGSTAPPRVLHMRGSSVWVQRGSGWKLLLDQDTTLASPPAGAPPPPAPPAAH